MFWWFEFFFIRASDDDDENKHLSKVNRLPFFAALEVMFVVEVCAVLECDKVRRARIS